MNKIETHFGYDFCLAIEQALRYKFPEIKNLNVETDKAGTAHVVFEETKYSKKEVEDYLNEIRNSNLKELTQ